MESIFFHYLTLWRPLGYAVIFFGLLIEGEIVLFAAAFLARQGFFDLGDLFLISIFGILIGDSLWYALGVWLDGSGTRLGRWASRVSQPFDHHLSTRPFHTVFLSKFTYGIHHAILVRAGALGLGWPTLIKFDLPATLIWTVIVGGLGFFSGASFSLVRHYLKFVEVALVISLIIFLVFWHFVAKRTKQPLTDESL